MEGKVSTLRLMFPSCSTEQAVEALKKFNWDIDSTIDYLLVETEKEEKELKVKQQKQEEENLYREFLLSENQQKQIQQEQIESEEDKIVKEFLILDGRQSPKPDEVVPHSNNNNNNNNNDNSKPDEVVPHVEPIHNNEAQDVELVKKDVSILQSITNTLKELEAEVKALAFGGNNNNNNEVKLEHKPDEVVPHVEPIHKPDEIVPHPNNNNNNNVESIHKPDEVVPHHENFVIPPSDNNNNNNNNNNNEFVLQVEIDNAIKQIELAFNSSLEKTEQILLTLKDEIKSWKIRDNVSSLTRSVRSELSDILAALARLISPTSVIIDANTQAQIDENAIKEREAKRLELEKKLVELKEHNRRLEEERKIAIEKLESKKYSVSEVKNIQPQQATLIPQPEIPKPQQATSIVIPSQQQQDLSQREESPIIPEQQPVVSKNPFNFITSIFKKDN